MRRMSKNIGFLLASQGVAAAAGILVLALSARYLGPTRFGQLAVIRAILGVSMPIIAGGLRANIIKQISGDPQGAAEYLGSLLTLRWAIALVTSTIAVIVIRVLPLSWPLELAGYAAILWALSNLWDAICRAIFIAYERSDYNLRLSVAYAFLVVLLTYLAIRLDLGVAGILGSQAVAILLVVQVGLFIAYRHFVRPKPRVNLGRWLYILRRSLPIGVSSMLKQSYDRIDVWLLAALRGSTDAGIFNGAYRVIVQTTPAAILTANAILPRLSLLAQTARDQLRIAFEHILLICLIISVPAAGAIYSLAGPIVTILLGAKFIPSIGALRIVSVMVATSIPDALLFFCLIALGKEMTATWCLVASIVVNATLDLILIPIFGVRGACFGTVGAEWTFFTSALIMIHRDLQLTSLWQFVGKPLAAGVVMGAVMHSLSPQAPLPGFLAGLLVFLASLYLLRAMPRGSIRTLRKALVPPAQTSP